MPVNVNRNAERPGDVPCALCEESSCPVGRACSVGQISWVAGGLRSLFLSRCLRSHSLVAITLAAPAPAPWQVCKSQQAPACSVVYQGPVISSTFETLFRTLKTSRSSQQSLHERIHEGSHRPLRQGSISFVPYKASEPCSGLKHA